MSSPHEWPNVHPSYGGWKEGFWGSRWGRLEFLEEKSQAIKDANVYGNINVTQLYLISNGVIPPKFKTPNFEKYNRATYQKATRLCTAKRCQPMLTMTNYPLFQDRLVCLVSRWYMHLDGSQVHRWKDLAKSIMRLSSTDPNRYGTRSFGPP